MSRFASLLVGTILFAVGTVSMRAQTPSIKDIVLTNEQKFSELQIQRKCDDAARMLDRNFRGISGDVGDRGEFLAQCQSNEVVPTRETFSHLNFTAVSPDTALVTYEDDESFLVEGRVGTLKAYVASVWVPRGSDWLLGLHASTSIPFVITDQGKLRLVYSDSAEERDESAGQ